MTARDGQMTRSYGSNGAVTRFRSASTPWSEAWAGATPEIAKASGPPAWRAQAYRASAAKGKWTTVAGGAGKNVAWKFDSATTSIRLCLARGEGCALERPCGAARARGPARIATRRPASPASR